MRPPKSQRPTDMPIKWHRDQPREGMTIEKFLDRWVLSCREVGAASDLRLLLLQAQDEAYERAANVAEEKCSFNKRSDCVCEVGERIGKKIRSLKSKWEER